MVGIQTHMLAELIKQVRLPYLILETIIADSFVGSGCKRTPAFTVDLTEEQFKEWREQFWDTRVEGKAEVWEIIRQACEAEDEGKFSFLISFRYIQTHN